MTIRAFTTPQDLVDAISETTYMAIFDDASSGSRTAVDVSRPVLSVIARAHANVASFLPRIYTTMPPEVPAANLTLGGDNISILLKDAELQWATIYSYRRHPEYVRTYGAEPNGPLTKEVLAMLERIAGLFQQIPATDSPPAPKPGLPLSIVYSSGPRIISDNADGTPNQGDF